MIRQKPHRVTIRGCYYNSRTLPSLNDYLQEIGRNPRAGGKFKDGYMKICINAIRRCLKGWVVEHPPVILHYEFHESKRGKRRDVMNIFSCADKFFEDALVKSGVLHDDSPDWVANTTHEFYWEDTTEPWIQIDIEEIGQ